MSEVKDVKLLINGSMMEVPMSIQTVTDLIKHLDLSSPVIIVEHNQVILKKDEHENAQVKDGDKIEFIQFVGGG